jgi:hypothetical protein
VVNICAEECRVFSTKDRAPFYLCFELIRMEEDEYEKKSTDNIWPYDIRLSQPLTIKNINPITNKQKQSFLIGNTTN